MDEASARKVLIGTSGWSYRDWVGPFYPEGTPAREYLSHYARQFPVVEVDSTFYAQPRQKSVENWARQTPDSFRFALKVPRTVTHGTDSERADLARVLRDRDGEVERFLENLEPLGERLACLVFQFPYFRVREMAAADFLERLGATLERLPRDRRAAVEIRNKSWISPTYLGLLETHCAAAVLNDHPYMPPPTQLLQLGMVTTDFAYVRLLGDRHAIERETRTWERIVVDREDSLDEWAGVIQEVTRRPGVRRIYTFSNNHYAGHAPATCRDLAARLDSRP